MMGLCDGDEVPCCFEVEEWQWLIILEPLPSKLFSMFILVFKLACNGTDTSPTVADIPVVLPMSSIWVLPPTNIGDCLASVGEVGIKLSSSSSNFVWVHFELVPGKFMLFAVKFTFTLSDGIAGGWPSVDDI